MPRTYNYSSLENTNKLKTFLKKPKTIKEIIKKFNLSSQNQGRQFITAATFKIEIYEFTQNGQLLYGIMK